MGKVYILTNDLMPGTIKIGITESTVEERIKTLDNTSVPMPFRFYFAIESDRFKEIESFVHNAFADFRVRSNREFFKMEPERAVAALRIAGCQEIKTANEMIDDAGIVVEEAEYVERTSKKKFSFAKVNIPVGSELTFTRNENKKCLVYNENEVSYENQLYSLSALADKLMTELGYNWKTIQGPRFFEYNGKVLSDIKKEIEELEEE